VMSQARVMSAAYLHLTRRVFGARDPEQRGRNVIIFDFPDRLPMLHGSASTTENASR
jgi:hypothetical protein